MLDPVAATVEELAFGEFFNRLLETLEMHQRTLGPLRDQTVVATYNLFNLYRDSDRAAEAAKLVEDLAAKQAVKYRVEKSEHLRTLFRLGVASRESGQLQVAEQQIHNALSGLRQNGVTAGDSTIQQILLERVSLYQETERPELEVGCLRELLANTAATNSSYAR